MEIVLIEDSLLDARLTIAALQKGDLRHRLTLLRDGQEGLEFLTRHGKFAQAPRPDLILLDLLLPHKDGLEILDAIKQDRALKEIPIVILTAADDEALKTKCELFHVQHFLRKPVNFDAFLEVIRQLKSHWHRDLILPALD
jgi:CheY-like chemotaxis protein